MRAKRKGFFAGTSWLKLLRLLPSPTAAWPVEDFAEPVQEDSAAGLMQFNSPMGRFWAPSSDRGPLGSTIIEMLSSVYEYGDAVIKHGDLVFDLGANLGTFSRLAFAKGAAKVVAFEAQAVYQRCLQRTFSREITQGTFELICSPVWSRRTTVRFTGRSMVGHVAADGEEDGVTMESVTLDQVVDALRLPGVDFLKADIEGAERHALEGASGLMRRFRPRGAFCVYHLPDDPEVIGGFLKRVQPGYRVVFETSGRYVYFW